MEMIHPQWHLIETVHEHPAISLTAPISPRTNAINRVQSFMETLTESQIPTFLSSLDNITEKPVAPIADPTVVTKKRGRPMGAQNKRDKSAFEYVEKRKCT
jgi:hypothetical protein